MAIEYTIYDSEDTSTDAVTPTLTVSDITGTFERGERIKGNTSGARGRLVTTSSPLSFTQTFGEDNLKKVRLSQVNFLNHSY